MRHFLIFAAAFFCATAKAQMPFSVSQTPNGVVVTAILDEARNQGNVEVGERIFQATRANGIVAKVTNVGQLQAYVGESRPSRMIFLHFQKGDHRAIKVVPLQ